MTAQEKLSEDLLHQKFPSLSNSFFKYLKFLLLWLIGLSPLAGYIVGTYYYERNLQIFGVDPSLFPLSPQETYVKAHLVASLYISDVMLVLGPLLDSFFYNFGWAWCVVAMIALWVSFNTISRTSEKHKASAIEWVEHQVTKLHWRNNYLTLSAGLVGGSVYLLLLLVTSVMMAGLIWLFLITSGYSKAEHYAMSQRDKYLEKGCSVIEDGFSICSTLKTQAGTIVHEGVLVTQSPKFLAFFKKDGTYIIQRPNQSVIYKSFLPQNTEALSKKNKEKLTSSSS